MSTRLHPAPVAPGTIPQPIIVIGALVLCSLVYSLASGSGSGRDLESDRLVVSECWKSIDRRAETGLSRRDLADGCARMERGFHLKHGATL
jgi:hypothetical protein